MAELTVGRMAKLYGLHRSTLYEAIDKGRLSCGFNAKGQKVIDLSEMIRVHGEPPNDARHPTPSRQTPKTTPDSSELLDEIRKQTAVIERMADRIERLEQALLTLPPPSTQEGTKQPPQATADATPANDDPHGLRSLARALYDKPHREK